MWRLAMFTISIRRKLASGWAAKRGPARISAKSWSRKMSMPCSLEHQTIGTRSPPFWPARLARMSMSKSRWLITSKKAGLWLRPRGSTTASSKPALQHRSAPHYQEVQRIVQSGELGEVRYVRVWNYVNMFPLWDRTCSRFRPASGTGLGFLSGTGAESAVQQEPLPALYRWFWDYAGGWITDFGTHRLDYGQQIMGVEAPLSVNATGNRFTLKDDGQMPDVLQVTYEYPGFVLSYETFNINGHGLGGRTPDMKYYMMRGKEDRPHGEAFYGTNGALFCDRIGFEIYPEPKAFASQDLYQVAVSAPQGFRMERKQVPPKTPPTCMSRTSSSACALARSRLPTSRLDIGPPPCRIWATSATRSSGSFSGMPPRKTSKMLRTLQSCSAGKHENRGI